VTITWDDLSRDWLSFESEPRTHKGLDFRLDIRKRANCSGDFSECDLFTCLRETSAIAFHLSVPMGSFETEGDWFRMNAVRTADHWCIGVRLRHPFEDDELRVDVLQ